MVSVLLAAQLLLAGPSPTTTDDWRWQARWALREHLDLRLLEPAPAAAFADELALGRGLLIVPAELRGATLRVSARGVEVEPRGGEPRPLVEHHGESVGAVRGLALGDRGVLLLVEDEALGGERVLELRYRPAYEYPFRIGHAPRVRSVGEARGHAVMAKAGCFSCHSLHGSRQVGPSLDRESLLPRLRVRLASAPYRERLAALDADPSYGGWRAARADVLAAEGAERSRRWMHWHLVEPRFDDPQARMPSMGLTLEEIDAVGAFLLADDAD